MRTLIYIIPLIATLQVNSQRANSGESKIDSFWRTSLSTMRFGEDVNCTEIASADINNASPRILIVGGNGIIVNTTDSTFENKYQIQYHDFGCLALDYECMVEYNHKIFAYLTTINGKEWQRTVRRDVVGWKEWKRK